MRDGVAAKGGQASCGQATLAAPYLDGELEPTAASLLDRKSVV